MRKKYFLFYLLLTMEKAFKSIRIQNFKSIKDIELNCSRINLFIGKPNVGKSNILEALSLFAAPFSQDEKYLSEFIRYRNFSNLFYDDNIREPILITSNLGNGHLFYDRERWAFGLVMSDKSVNSNKLNVLNVDLVSDYLDSLVIKNTLISAFPSKNKDAHGEHIRFSFFQSIDRAGYRGRSDRNYKFKLEYTSTLKKYTFKEGINISSQGDYSLYPPFGDNLFLVVQTNPELRREIADFFEEYNMDFILDIKNNEFEVQKKVDGIVYKRPYQLIADTLKRIIFHYAAIYSNKDSILLFEEPENHSFPPYVRELAHKIVDDESNQFFITTHSPYLFNTIIENASREDVSVFITNFEQHQTKVKQLTEDEIAELSDHGADIFFNLNWFENE